MERRLVRGVAEIELGPGSEKDAEDLGLASDHRLMDRCAALRSGVEREGIASTTLLHERLEHSDSGEMDRLVDRRVPRRVAFIRAGAAREERSDEVDIAELRGDEERCSSLAVSILERSAAMQRRLDRDAPKQRGIRDVGRRIAASTCERRKYDEGEQARNHASLLGRQMRARSSQRSSRSR
jgi:hypothetical protein